MFRKHHRAGAAVALSLLLLGPGCGRKQTLLAPEQDPPVVALRATRAPSTEAGLTRYRVEWEATSGLADRFMVATHPRSLEQMDEGWTATRERSTTLAVPARDTRLAPSRESGRPVTHFFVRAVDRQGRMSPAKFLSLLDDNLAPSVQIVSPTPSSLGRAYLPPGAEVRWAGEDPDGVPHPVPELFKWKVLGPDTEIPASLASANPDSVRRYYEPGGYAGWDSAAVHPGGEGSTALLGITPGLDHVFVVVARDAAGDWNQVFNLNVNMLRFRCVPATVMGPVLTIYNESFLYRYPSPSYATGPQYEIPITVLSGTRFPIRWFGQPLPGADIAGYRWGLDLADPTGTGEGGGGPAGHWSPLSPTTTSATIGPFRPGETHLLFVEARDSNGLRSLGIVRIEVVAVTAQRPLLIVDDTRMSVDQRSASTPCMNPPVGRWPSAAELDSFLYARGGVPWRCYPAGVLSAPGIFAGYDFDTLGTRNYPGGTVPLSVLCRYQRVLWLIDALAAVNTGSPPVVVNQITVLRSMTMPGRQNTLAEYARGGGRVWVAGGGGVYASTIHYNRPQNDISVTGTTFSRDFGELAPGGFAHDVFGWRSEIKVSRSPITLTRWLGRHEGAGTVFDAAPLAMRARTSASDPFPPGRAFLPGNFYYSNFDLEYLSHGNDILFGDEGVANGGEGSALDSLYRATGPVLVPPGSNPYNVAMTRYHGAFRHNPVIFTGFDLWSFQRADCKALVDFVLQHLWGMSPAPGGAGGMARAEP